MQYILYIVPSTSAPPDQYGEHGSYLMFQTGSKLQLGHTLHTLPEKSLGMGGVYVVLGVYRVYRGVQSVQGCRRYTVCTHSVGVFWVNRGVNCTGYKGLNMCVQGCICV